MIKTRYWRVLFAALCVFVTWLTVTPNPDDTEGGMAFARWISDFLFSDSRYADKVGHFAAYGLLGVLAAFSDFSLGGGKWRAPTILAAYGALLEGVQALGGVRAPEFADAIANAAGALSGFGAIVIARRFLAKRAA